MIVVYLYALYDIIKINRNDDGDILFVVAYSRSINALFMALLIRFLLLLFIFYHFL